AVLRDPSAVAGIGQFAAIQAIAPIGLDLSVIDERDPEEIERDVAEFAHGPSGGLVVTASPFGVNHPDLIAAIASRHKLCVRQPAGPQFTRSSSVRDPGYLCPDNALRPTSSKRAPHRFSALRRAGISDGSSGSNASPDADATFRKSSGSGRQGCRTLSR